MGHDREQQIIGLGHGAPDFMEDSVADLPLVKVTSRHPLFLIMNRHPERVSGSIYQSRPLVCEA
jgi:hypothetical protein